MPSGRLRPASLLPDVLPHQHQRPTDYLRRSDHRAVRNNGGTSRNDRSGVRKTHHPLRTEGVRRMGTAHA